MTIKKTTIKAMFIYLYAFLVIYTPIFFENFLNKYNLLIILLIVMIVPYILKKDNSVFKILSNKIVMSLMLAVFLSSIYFFIVQLINNVPITNLSETRLLQNNLINIMIVHIAIIIDQLKKIGYTKEKCFKMLLVLGSIQGIICILMLLFPQLKDIAINLYHVEAKENSFIIASRIYGISSDYTFATPIYHGLLAGLAFFATIINKKKYFPAIVLILISVFLNGRTGLVVFAIAAFLSLLYLLIKKSNVLKFLKYCFLITILFLGTMILLREFAPSTYNFIILFINDTVNLLFNDQLTGNYEIIFEKTWYFPEGINMIFGYGTSVYSQKGSLMGFASSDIGYVNDLFMGGIVFAGILYLSVSKFLLKKIGTNNNYIYFIIFVITFFTNIKGEIFRASIFIFILIFIKMIDIVFYEKEENYGKS